MADTAIYIRWSTDEQGEGTTLEVQRESCISFCKSQGWTCREEHIIVDDGYSGGTLDRPGMAKLRAWVRQDKIERVVVYKLDRLSRSVVDCVDLVRREWDGRCTVVSSKEMFDTNTPMGQLFFNMLISFAEWERSVIKERTFSGKVKRAAQGRNPGGRLPYGYVKGEDAGSILIDEAQSVVVRRIYDLYVAGNGDRTIASLLNDDGIQSPRGGMWERSKVADILTSERYVGRWNYGETRKNERHRMGDGPKRVGNEPLAKADRPDLAIIPIDLWERVQRRRADTNEALAKTSGRALASEHLLSGLVRCRCGSAMNIAVDSRTNKRMKKPRYFYRCTGRQNKGVTFCDCGTVDEKVLDRAVLHYVHQLRTDDITAVVSKQAEESWRRRLQEAEAALAGTTRRLAELDTESARLRTDYRAGKLDADLFNELRAEVTAEQESSKQKQGELTAQLDALRAGDDNRTAMMERIERLAGWDGYTIAQRKELLRGLVNAVTVYRKANSGDDLSLDVDLNMPMP